MDAYDQRIFDTVKQYNERNEPIWVSKLITKPDLNISYVSAHRHIHHLLKEGILYQLDGRGVKVSENVWANVPRMLLYVHWWHEMTEEQKERAVRALESIAESLARTAPKQNDRKQKIETKVASNVQAKEGNTQRDRD